MATLEGTKRAMVNAHKEGDFQAAAKFYAVIKREEERRASDPARDAYQSVDPDVPGYVNDDIPWIKSPQPEEQPQDKGLLDRAMNIATGTVDLAAGPIEAAATVGTGATTGLATGLGSMFTEIAKSYLTGGSGKMDEYLRSSGPEEAFARGMDKGTYSPRSHTGQAIVKTAGELTENLPPIIAPGLSNMGMAGRSLANVPMIAKAKIRNRTDAMNPHVPKQPKSEGYTPASWPDSPPKGPDPQGGFDSSSKPTEGGGWKDWNTANGSPETPMGWKERTRRSEWNTPTGGPKRTETNVAPSSKVPYAQGGFDSSSVGAAQMKRGDVLRERAQELPIPFTNLYRSQLYGDQAGKQFLSSTGKQGGKLGDEIRAETSKQNLTASRNFDAWMEQTGEMYSELPDKGAFITEALAKVMKRDKQKTSALYIASEKAGEQEQAIQLTKLIKYVNKKKAEAILSPMLRAVGQKLVDIKAAKWVKKKDANKNIVKQLEAKDVQVVKAENIRKFLSLNPGKTETDSYQIARLKELYDKDTDTVAGKYYKKARASHTSNKRRYLDNILIKQLHSKKPGTHERTVAIEKVADYAVFSQVSNAKSLHHLRIILKREGGDGLQAWQEIQGSTLRKIQETMLNTAKRDSEGNPIPSYPKLKKILEPLDKSGKLEILFGKKGAEHVRTLRDVVELLYTEQPGTVNHSDTSTMAAFMIDMVGSSISGVPLPAALVAKHYAKARQNKKLKALLDREKETFN